MRSIRKDCSGVLEGFIGALSVALGVSLFFNKQSLVYLLLDYRELRIPMAYGFVSIGFVSCLAGVISYTRWRLERVRMVLDTALLSGWLAYSIVVNSFTLQFPVGMMSLIITPTLAALVAFKLRDEFRDR